MICDYDPSGQGPLLLYPFKGDWDPINTHAIYGVFVGLSSKGPVPSQGALPTIFPMTKAINGVIYGAWPKINGLNPQVKFHPNIFPALDGRNPAPANMYKTL